MARRALWAVALSLLAAAPARAEDEEAARALYHAGEVLYQRGDYRGAAHEFESGYQRSHRPEFRINLAQCYRKLAQPGRALAELDAFLAEAPPDHPQRPEVLELFSAMGGRVGAIPRPPRSRGEGPEAPELPPGAPAVEPPPLVLRAPPPALARPLPAWAISLIAAAAVVVAAAAVSIGVVLGMPSRPTPSDGTIAVGP